jgi:ubiquinone/menaquinone biosynthesis C-methylase UbiE
VHIAEEATDAVYEQWAPSYDGPGNPLLELDLPLIDDILARLPPGRGVDAACGTGRLAARLVARGHEVTGVDASEAMLQQARARVPDARFVLGDLAGLPLPACSVDVVTCGLALTHVHDLAPVFAEFARVLRPGGSVIVSDVHPGLLYRGSIVKSLSAAGEPQVAAYHRRNVADYVRAALAAGLVLRLLEEPRTAPASQPEAAPDRTVGELGDWSGWPWTLLDRIPEAARAAWDSPALLVMHLELSHAGAF